MNEIISIVVKSSISIALLYLIYILFLKRDTFFKTNRVYLVLTMLFSMIIPFIDLSGLIRSSDFTYAVLLDPVIITTEGVEASVMSNPDLYQILLAIYLTGLSIFTIRFAYQLGQLFFLVRKFGVDKKQGLNIVFTNKNFSPFSFFNLIFMNRQDINSEEAHKIIAHEKVHVSQWHSMDLILLEIITILQWFNPFVWLYRHAIKTLHEYLADQGVLLSGVDVNVYSALLFEQSTGIQINDLTNNFSKSLLKRRFIMMNKKKTTQFARIKLLFAVPLAISMMLVMSFSHEVLAQNTDKSVQKQATEERLVTAPDPTAPPPPPKKIEIIEDPQDEKNPIFTVVEEMPEYPGGKNAMYKFMGENIKYPENAKEEGISGTVFITFVVEKDGRVNDVKLLRGVDESLDKEAMRVIKMMPNWKPGKQSGKTVRVQYNLPVKFALDSDKEEKEKEK